MFIEKYKKLNKQLKITILGIGVVILLGIMGGGYYYWWTGTPEYSVAQIKKAIEMHNPDLGLKYINIDAIFENLWTDMKSELMKETEKAEGFETFGMMLGVQLAESMKPTLKEQVKEGIKSWFSVPIEEKSKETTTTKESLETGTFLQKDLKIKKQGNSAYIELPDNIKIVFTRKAGERYWVISKIEGFTDNLLSKESQQQSVSTKESENKKIKDVDVSLPKSEYIPPAPTSAPPTRIEGLASIRMDGGIWENWDADAEKDGPFIEVVYLDSRGEIITTDEAKNLPISADVKIFTTDTSNYSFKKGRLVFSAHYSKEQIIFGNTLYPKIRIPKEQINVNPKVDYPYGYASITIHTPEQGDFSDESNLGFIVLYEK